MSLRAAYARAILEKNVTPEIPKSALKHDLLPVKSGFIDAAPEPPSRNVPVGIIGAGVAGLAVALCLHIAGYENVEILEAHPDRVGGRCYTHNFKNGVSCEHNYYDVGAMRIPDIPTMKSTFQWRKWLNEGLKSLGKPEVELKDYVYDANCEPSMYFYDPKAKGSDDLKKFMMDPKTGILTTKGFLDSQTLKPTADFNEAFVKYINGPDQPDQYSTRAFLMHKVQPPWSYQATEEAETFNTSTGLYDQAFMETICDFYDFQAAKNRPWYRVEGGMSKLTDALYTIATNTGTKVIKNAPVSSISANDADGTVTAKYPNRSATYKALFTTTTLGALQRMDLSGLKLPREQLIAIRGLSYDRATKIAIKFSKPWWISIMPSTPENDPPYQYGGVSSSDLSISNVVYPSWNDGDQAHTIIVSYSWAQDATRMASMIFANDVESTDVTDPLIVMIFSQLQKLWSSVPAAEDVVNPSALAASYIAHHPFSWAHDPQATGGFALFGPGQFEYLYTKLLTPLVDNRFIVCGEAISVHHAWISGALDSAYNAVWSWLGQRHDEEGQQALKSSPVGVGPDQNTAELDSKCSYLVAWQAALTQKKEQET